MFSAGWAQSRPPADDHRVLAVALPGRRRHRLCRLSALTGCAPSTVRPDDCRSCCWSSIWCCCSCSARLVGWQLVSSSGWSGGAALARLAAACAPGAVCSACSPWCRPSDRRDRSRSCSSSSASTSASSDRSRALRRTSSGHRRRCLRARTADHARQQRRDLVAPICRTHRRRRVRPQCHGPAADSDWIARAGRSIEAAVIDRRRQGAFVASADVDAWPASSNDRSRRCDALRRNARAACRRIPTAGNDRLARACQLFARRAAVLSLTGQPVITARCVEHPETAGQATHDYDRLKAMQLRVQHVFRSSSSPWRCSCCSPPSGRRSPSPRACSDPISAAGRRGRA